MHILMVILLILIRIVFIILTIDVKSLPIFFFPLFHILFEFFHPFLPLFFFFLDLFQYSIIITFPFELASHNLFQLFPITHSFILHKFFECSFFIFFIENITSFRHLLFKIINFPGPHKITKFFCRYMCRMH